VSTSATVRSDARSPPAGASAERSPADADLPLAQFAGEERDARGDLGGVEPAQRGGQVGDLLAARGRCADSAGRFDEFGEEHNSILAQRVTAGQNERMFGTLFRSPAVRPRPAGFPSLQTRLNGAFPRAWRLPIGL